MAKSACVKLWELLSIVFAAGPMSGRPEREANVSRPLSLRGRRAFAVGAVAAMVLAGAYVAVIWSSRGTMENEPVVSPVPGWEPWFFYVDGMVNGRSGNLFLDFTDLRVKARGWTLEVVRAYNAQSASLDGDFGYGWTWNYGTKLVPDVTGNVTWFDGDGSQHVFDLVGNGVFTSPPGIRSKLVGDGDTYTLWHLDGSRWTFDEDGLPTAWVDKNRNDLTFTWSPKQAGPELLKVEDDSGLNLTFTYTSGRITKVEDPLGREVSYAYDRSGNLDTVTDPLEYEDDFDYDNGHLLLEWVDRAGAQYEFDYDASDRLTDFDVSAGLLGGSMSKMSISYDLLVNGVGYANVTNAREDMGSVRSNADGLPDRIEPPLAGACGSFVLCQRLCTSPPGPSGCGSSGGCGSCGGCRQGCANGAPGSCSGSGSATLDGELYLLTWDEDFNLLEVEDALGNVREYAYDGYGNVETYTDPLGNETSWGWSVTDNATAYVALLANWTNARDYAWTYAYDGHGNRINETDPLGNYSTMGYDAYGYATSRTDFRGNTWTSAYDTHGYLLNVTDPLGNLTEYEYDDVGRVTAVTNARGYETAYAWDDGDRLTSVTDALGNETSFTYDGRGDRLTVTDGLDRTTTTAWNLTVGKVANVTDPLGNKTYYAYDGEGNLLEVTNRRGYETSYAYDDLNRLTNVTDALGNETSYTYDDAGRMATITDRRGAETTFDYDALGRRTSTTDALGNVTYLEYDEVGNLVTLTNARGYDTQYSYDELNRLVEVEDALGNETSYAYDENGNLVEIEDPNGHSTAFTYDELNRRTSVTDSLDHATTLAYDEVGNLVSVEDANGNVREYEYDALDRRTVERDALDDETTYEYDAVGNLVGLTDANGHTMTQSYDDLDRLVEVVRPLGNTTAYEYDEEGNLVVRVDPKGQQTNYTYDALNRLVQIDYPDDSSVIAEYDEEGNTVYAEGFGFSRTDAHDLLGRVTEIEFDFGPFNKTVAYAYDEVGNRLTMTDGEDDTTEYEWDALDRLVSMTAPDDLTFEFAYDAASRRTNLTYPNGMYTATTYDDANWVTFVESRRSNDTLLESFEYAYDDVGNRVEVAYENDTTVEYGYDDTYRLVAEDYSWGLAINYTYDGTGNRLAETRNDVTTNYTYDAEDHLLTRGNATYAWDENGNLAKKVEWDGNTTYEWDYENRLVEVELPDETTLAYAYDARNMRVSESVEDETTYLFYDFYDLTHKFEDLIAEYNETGTRRTAYAHGPGADEPLAVTRDDATEYYMHDALGSVTRITTTAQATSASFRYEAFGEARDVLEGVSSRYRFTARELDISSGLYYHRARWYDPQVGRFLAKDPLSDIASTSFVQYARLISDLARDVVERTSLDEHALYVYARNSPPNFVDPGGTACFLGCWWKCPPCNKNYRKAYLCMGWKQDAPTTCGCYCEYCTYIFIFLICWREWFDCSRTQPDIRNCGKSVGVY